MHTVRGRFNGTTIELLDDTPIRNEAYVLVTFLEGSLETAAARSRRSVSVATFSLDHYGEPLPRRIGAEQSGAPVHRGRGHRRAVVREHGRPAGIISDTDIFQIVEERGWGPEQE